MTAHPEMQPGIGAQPDPVGPPAGPAARPRRSPGLAGRLKDVARWVWLNKALTVILLVWLLILLVAIFPGWFTSGDPNAQQLLDRLQPPGSPHHVLGTDQLGNDILTELIYGTRTSVIVGVGAVLIGGSIGTVAGMISGYANKASTVVGVVLDVAMAFPGILLALSVVIMIGHANEWILAIVLGVTGWTAYTRVLTGVVRSLRTREFVLAARASGRGPIAIAFGHILPNIATPLRILAVVDMSRAVLAEAGLSFLGLGIQPPSVSWGLMLGGSEDYVYTAWWLVVMPGIAIGIVVLSLTVLASVLQARSDPARRLLRRSGLS
jgi:peptide/nickel transport system permease protein